MQVRFDDDTVDRTITEITQTDPILVDLETESSKNFDNTHEKMTFLIQLLQQSTTMKIIMSKPPDSAEKATSI